MLESVTQTFFGSSRHALPFRDMMSQSTPVSEANGDSCLWCLTMAHGPWNNGYPRNSEKQRWVRIAGEDFFKATDPNSFSRIGHCAMIAMWSAFVGRSLEFQSSCVLEGALVHLTFPALFWIRLYQGHDTLTRSTNYVQRGVNLPKRLHLWPKLWTFGITHLYKP